MRAVGVITEYNPFHNGHLYHVQQARRSSDAEVVVAVMSGHFLQRGEPALLDKWTRAQMALAGGVDVVVELPFAYACNSAPTFARGAVMALDNFAPHLDCLCFGSESGDLPQLQQLSLAMQQSELLPPDRQNCQHLRSGKTFPQARAEQLQQAGHDITLLNQPNNILSLAYLRALTELHCTMRPLTITRKGSNYHDDKPTHVAIASATAVRQLLLEKDDVSAYLPNTAFALLDNAVTAGQVMEKQRWFSMVQQACFTLDKNDGDYYQLDSGLVKRVYQAALVADDFDSLVSSVKARQLTRTRIQRVLCYLVAGLHGHSTAQHLSLPPAYLQLLGTTARGEQFLSQCRKDGEIPLVGNMSRINAIMNRRYAKNTPLRDHAQWQLDLEDKMTRLYTMLLPGWAGKSRQWNYYQSPVRML